MRVILVVLLLLVILSPIKSPVISDSNNSYYPVNIVMNEESLVDTINPAAEWGFASYLTTYNNTQLVYQQLITFGIGSLEEDGYISYFDNNYPYKIVNITDINNINSVEDLVNTIKKSKVFMLATKSYSYWMQYDSESKKLIIHTYLVVNNHVIGSTDLGYYDYLHSVPPDNSPTRVALLVTPFSGILHPEHWKDYYEQKYGKQVYEVETDPPVKGLYSVDINVVFDFYPMVVYNGGQIEYFAPGEFPKVYYDNVLGGVYTDLDKHVNILELPSILTNFINMFFTGEGGINTGAEVDQAFQNVMSSDSSFATSWSYMLAYDILSSSLFNGYAGHYRVGIIYNTPDLNASLLIQGSSSGTNNGGDSSGNSGGSNSNGSSGGDNSGGGSSGGGGGMICPPGSSWCNLPTSKNLASNKTKARW